MLEKPEEYREVIKPLQKYPGDNQPFGIFLEQNERWKDNRGLEVENDTYDAHVKEATFWAKRMKLDWVRADFEDKLKRNPLFLEP